MKPFRVSKLFAKALLIQLNTERSLRYLSYIEECPLYRYLCNVPAAWGNTGNFCSRKIWHCSVMWEKYHGFTNVLSPQCAADNRNLLDETSKSHCSPWVGHG